MTSVSTLSWGKVFLYNFSKFPFFSLCKTLSYLLYFQRSTIKKVTFLNFSLLVKKETQQVSFQIFFLRVVHIHECPLGAKGFVYAAVHSVE